MAVFTLTSVNTWFTTGGGVIVYVTVVGEEQYDRDDGKFVRFFADWDRLL